MRKTELNTWIASAGNTAPSMPKFTSSAFALRTVSIFTSPPVPSRNVNVGILFFLALVLVPWPIAAAHIAPVEQIRQPSPPIAVARAMTGSIRGKIAAPRLCRATDNAGKRQSRAGPVFSSSSLQPPPKASAGRGASYSWHLSQASRLHRLLSGHHQPADRKPETCGFQRDTARHGSHENSNLEDACRLGRLWHITGVDRGIGFTRDRRNADVASSRRSGVCARRDEFLVSTSSTSCGVSEGPLQTGSRHPN